jgi:hypothetical protein
MVSHPALPMAATVAERDGGGASPGDEGEQDRGERTPDGHVMTRLSFPSWTALESRMALRHRHASQDSDHRLMGGWKDSMALCLSGWPIRSPLSRGVSLVCNMTQQRRRAASRERR